MPNDEKFKWLIKLKKILVPSQNKDEIDEAFVKLRNMAKELGVEISRLSAMNGLRGVPVMSWDSVSVTYHVRYPSEADKTVCIGIITVAVLLIIFSDGNEHFSYESINGFDSLCDYFAKIVCDETAMIVQILQKWGIQC